jgi:hypothetical protein
MDQNGIVMTMKSNIHIIQWFYFNVKSSASHMYTNALTGYLYFCIVDIAYAN